MKKSLQDQLLKAGLGNKQQARQINTAKKKQQKQPKNASNQGTTNAQAARQAQAEKDRQRNLELQEQAQAKALQVQINQLIDSNKLSTYERGLPYYFLDGRKVYKLKVDEKTRIRLAFGQVGIAKNGDDKQPNFHLLPENTIQKLKDRKAEKAVVWHQSPNSLKDYLEANDIEDWSYPKGLFD